MSVCLSFCSHRPVLYRNAEWIEFIHGIPASVDLSTLCSDENVGMSAKLNVLPSGILFQALDLQKFHHNTSTVDRTCCQQSTDDCRLFNTLSVQLCAKRDERNGSRRADPPATAETCLFSARTYGTIRQTDKHETCKRFAS